MKIKNLRKAVSCYKQCNAGGRYDSRYGVLMLDRSTGELWTDEFSDFGRGSFAVYDDPSLCNLSHRIKEAELDINEATVKMFAEKLCRRWKDTGKIKRFFVRTMQETYVILSDGKGKGYFFGEKSFDEPLTFEVAQKADYSNVEGCETLEEIAANAYGEKGIINFDPDDLECNIKCEIVEF